MSMIAPHTVTWSRNTINGMQSGSDEADSFTEACEIAEARARGAGIPATAYVSEKSTSKWSRRYARDFDGRTSYVDGEKA